MKKLLLALLFVCGATAAASESPVGLPGELLGHVAYYTSFDTEDWEKNPEVDRFKITVDKRCPIAPGKGIRGAALQNTTRSHGHFTTKSPDIGLDRGRTFSVWLRYGDDPTSWHTIEQEHGFGIGMNIIAFSSRPQTNAGHLGFHIHGIAATGHEIGGVIHSMPGMQAIGGNVRDFVAFCPPGKWHNFVIASNGQRIAWYVNGKKFYDLTLPAPLEYPFTFDQCTIGGHDVRLDEFVIFDIALTAEAVAEYHASVRYLLLRESMFD